MCVICNEMARFNEKYIFSPIDESIVEESESNSLNIF